MSEPARAQPVHQLRQHAQPLPRHARAHPRVHRLGRRRRRAAAEHLSAHRGRHPGHRRRLSRDVPRAFPIFACPKAICVRAPRPRALPSRAHRRRGAAGHGQGVRDTGPAPGRRRQRPGWHRAAGAAGAARHPHRLQHTQRGGGLPGPPAAGTAARRSRARRRSGRPRRSAPRSRCAMPTVPPTSRRCARRPPPWSARAFCCRRTSMCW